MLHQPKIKLFNLRNSRDRIAQDLFESVGELPLICPHGHVPPQLFSTENEKFDNPAELFITSDHYVLRMLLSQGVRCQDLGIQGVSDESYISAPEQIWQIFCDHYHLFDGTPTGLWIENILAMVFGIMKKPDSENAIELYQQMAQSLRSASFNLRKLFQKFNIEVLCTTDDVTDSLNVHQEISQAGWQGRILPTLRMDRVVDIQHPTWPDHIQALSSFTHQEIVDYRSFIWAIEKRRTDYQALGCKASDLSLKTPYTCQLSNQKSEEFFQLGLKKQITDDEALQFKGQLILELARMSAEDGMVMQLRAGIYRNHSPGIFQELGPDMGFDIPVKVEWTQNLKPLLDAYGMDTNLCLILFTLDESNYARELAPIAGAYPAIKLGPPWWFNDSPQGIRRYFDSVMETAGFENTVGFNDDARNFLSIPARHDLWRRISALWLADLVQNGQLSGSDARKRMADLAYGLAKSGYRLDQTQYS